MAYCRQVMRHPFLIFAFTGLLVLGGGIASFSVPDRTLASNTVEINLAETSPKGEAGGYAIPASGSSYSCTMYGMPASMYQGQTFTLLYSPDISMSVTRNGVSRGTAAGSPWTDSTSASLGVGTYTYALSGQVYAGEHCLAWGLSCTGDPKSGYTCMDVCTGTGPFYNTYTCSGNLSVVATLADLVSSNIAIQSGATGMTQNQSYTLVASTTNSGGTAAGAFSDTFAYGYGGSGGSFTVINTVSRPSGLAAGAGATDTSSSFSPVTPGTITIRHCVDSASQISESNEANNCTYRNYTVTGSISASCSPSPTTVDENENVTWTASASGGTPGYSYAWSGTDGLSGSGTSTVKSYANSGTKTGSVTVTDTLGVSSGVVSCSASVTVDDTSPTANIRARVLGSGSGWSNGPITIAALDEVELEWSSTNATSCSGDTYYSTGGDTSGSTGSVAEAAGGQSRTYTVSCTGNSQTAEDTVQVNRDAPTLPPTLSADPTRVRQGETTTLEGNLNGHSGCTITGGSTDISVPDGTGAYSYTSGVILGETTLTLECLLGEASDTVRILPSVEHF